MIKIRIEDIIKMQEVIVAISGGEKGVKDIRLLESALESPFATFSGKDLNETDADKITALVYSIVKNHAFQDANKRVSVLVLKYLVIDSFNIKSLEEYDNELYELIIALASNTKSKEDLLNFVNKLVNNIDITIGMVPPSMRQGSNEEEIIKNYKEFLR